MAHHSHDPYDAPPLRGLGLVRTTLRVFVALQCWGYAAAHLHFRSHSALALVLEKEFFLSSRETLLVDRAAAFCLVLCGIVCLLRPAWPLLLAVSGGHLAFVASKAWLGVGSHPAITLISHTCVILSPFILACADFWPGRRKFSLGFWIAIAWLMRLAVCLTFIGLGLEGIIHSHQNGELVRVSAGAIEKWTMNEPSSLQAKTVLTLASSLQIGIGISLALKRSRAAATLAAVVGVFIAGCYSLGLGMAGYPRTLIHLIDGGMAAALGLYWAGAIQEGQHSYIPEGFSPQLQKAAHH